MSRDRRARYQGIRVAVLGATGFIGRWVARQLGAQGADLYLTVRNASSAREIFARYGIHGHLVELDLLDRQSVRRFYQDVRPSITFNLAAYAVDRSQRDEKLAYAINEGIVTIICEEIARTRDTGWSGQDLVHAGTAFEYGAIHGDLTEDSVPRPTTLYGRSKLAGTSALTRFCQSHDLDAVVARLFTVYGYGERSGRLLPSLLEVARNGGTLSLTAGTQRRDFSYVEDVADGLLRLGLAAPRRGEIVNVATGRMTSVRSFVETAARILGIPDDRLSFGAIPNHYEEMEHNPVQPSRLRRLTGWSPPTDIADGVRKTLEHVQRLEGSSALVGGTRD